MSTKEKKNFEITPDLIKINEEEVVEQTVSQQNIEQTTPKKNNSKDKKQVSFLVSPQFIRDLKIWSVLNQQTMINTIQKAFYYYRDSKDRKN